MELWLILANILLLGLFVLVIIGLTTKANLAPISIVANNGKFNKQCLTEKVSCNSDDDCFKSCTEAQTEEIVCQSIPDIPQLTKTQQSMLGSTTSIPQKYCVPSKAKMNCNLATGGIPVFTGWGATETMDFECMCSYPLWANSRICDRQTGTCQGSCQLNPGICQGGTFRWDLTKKSEEPIASLCECGQGDVLIVDNNGLPRCVPEGIQSFYSDLDISTGRRGGQDQILIDNVPMKAFMPSACADKGPSAAQTTTCAKGCCSLPNAVCCGTGCCPSNFPVCDEANNRCLKSNTTCTANETKCDKGCCSLPNAVCCSNGVGCCPPNFPLCDPDKPYCNPYPTALKNETCNYTEETQCANGCCPFPDGVCCGAAVAMPDGTKAFACCPAEYPVCDLKYGMCRKN